MWGERSTEVASSGSQQRGRCQNTPWSDLVFVSQRCCPRQQSPCFLSVLLVGPLQAGHVRRRADRNVEALATGLTEHRAAVEPLGLARLPAEIAPVADLPRNPDTVVADRTSGARRVAERARGGAARRPPRCSSGDGWCRRSAPSHASLPSVSPRCARVGGVSVHANVPACDRRWLERLCRFRGSRARGPPPSPGRTRGSRPRRRRIVSRMQRSEPATELSGDRLLTASGQPEPEDFLDLEQSNLAVSQATLPSRTHRETGQGDSAVWFTRERRGILLKNSPRRGGMLLKNSTLRTG